MKEELVFDNPRTVHRPLGPYSHTAVVPAGARLLFISGQVGARLDGTAGETIGEQAEQAFRNLNALLEAHGLDLSRIVKLTVFIVDGHDGEAVRKARVKCLGALEPTSTTVYVSKLAGPMWLVEVEAIAAWP